MALEMSLDARSVAVVLSQMRNGVSPQCSGMVGNSRPRGSAGRDEHDNCDLHQTGGEVQRERSPV